MNINCLVSQLTVMLEGVSAIKRNQRGALFIEYAVAMAFVVVVGTLFMSNNSLINSIEKVFHRTSALLAGKYITSASDFWDAVKTNDTKFKFGTSENEANGIIDYLMYYRDYEFVSGAGDAGFKSGETVRPIVEGLNDGKPIESAPKGIEMILEQSGYAGIENVSWSVLKGTDEDGRATKYLYVADQRYTTKDFNQVGTFLVTRYDLNKTDKDGQLVEAHLDKSNKTVDNKKYEYVVVRPGPK